MHYSEVIYYTNCQIRSGTHSLKHFQLSCAPKSSELLEILPINTLGHGGPEEKLSLTSHT